MVHNPDLVLVYESTEPPTDIELAALRELVSR
jgi:hypothetical protein